MGLAAQCAVRGGCDDGNIVAYAEQIALLTLGRDTCGNWDGASRYEWLVTNGLGGFACGTVAGANTRRYHGFLVASLNPPVERMLLVAKVDLSAHYLGVDIDLSANEFAGGAISGQGFAHLESFAVQDGIPTWRYAFADALLEQRIFMAPGANTSYLRLELLRASAPLRVILKPLIAYRDYHSHGRGAQPFQLEPHADECRVQAFAGARPYRLSISQGQFSAAPAPEWYWNFWHRVEAERGLDASEDLLMPGLFATDLSPQQPVYLLATAETAAPAPGADVLAALKAASQRLIAPLPTTAPAWIRTLAQATDQFVVRRGATGGAPAPGGSKATRGTETMAAAAVSASSIIAGYPWFTDWGRDTMISLPGLATSLGRYDVAARILRTYAGFADRGMLPNRFPDGGEAPHYNTADATLWMFHALEDYLQANRDPDLVRELFPVLMAIIHAHSEGTRYGIQVDPADGLLRAGAPGTQLTWMDAKYGDEVFTPRIGKPVEINALWLNALDVGARLAGQLHSLDEQRFCRSLLERATASFSSFWNERRGCLYDVIDVDGASGRDARIRPNQIFAVSLPYSPLAPEQMRAVVDCCGRELLTSHGLRSLSPTDPGYVGHCEGDAHRRDAAYHMGTVWGWLLGPFARAHYRAHGDARRAQSFLAPMAQHLDSACVGSLSEIFDGDAPHSARGCFAQAWSVAEILRSWIYLERKISTK
jgi:glycogen debranching enzyme